jgi:signal transduction histidine kinase
LICEDQRVRRAGIVTVIAAGVTLGLTSERYAYDVRQMVFWLPDLIVGLAWVGCGVLCWRRSPAVGGLALAVAATWFAAPFIPAARFWHRGPLIHLLVTAPVLRPRPRTAVVAVVAGYAAAVGFVGWQDGVSSVFLAAALVLILARLWSSDRGAARRFRGPALWAGSAWTLVVAGSAVAGRAFPRGDAALAALLAYEVVLLVIAVGLTATVLTSPMPAITDLVIELSETSSQALRARLAKALGDPQLDVGYWRPEAEAYLNDRGEVVRASDGTHVLSRINRDGRPYAALRHAPAVLDDPALLAAVTSATALAASHTALRAEVRRQAEEVAASRRRLQLAADDERSRLAHRLQSGAEARLARLADHLGGSVVEIDDVSVRPHLIAAVGELEPVLDELRDLEQGLHPRELSQGLAYAVAALIARFPVATTQQITTERCDPEVEAAAYFICAEALTNVFKHAAATRAHIEVAAANGGLRVMVTDDGRGGADPTSGTGLVGLADRIEALGGGLTVQSPPGSGTRILADIPGSQYPVAPS